MHEATSEPDHWMPDISPKQIEIVESCHPDNPNKSKYTLLSGPRKSGKTVGALHALALHAWEVNKAHISVLAPSISAADDGGSWQLLVEEVIPAWIDGIDGMEWVEKPKLSSSSKRPRCKVRNKHGTVSTIQLDSMPEEGEKAVSRRFKNKKFSMVYWIEVADWVKERKTFDVVTECLRGYKDNEMQMLLDTNPAEEGEDHWCFQLWYVFRKLTDDKCDTIASQLGTKSDSIKAMRDCLGLFEVFVHDNPYLSEQEVAELEAKYIHNQDLYDRYMLGKWTTASGDALFFDIFVPAVHVIGDPATMAEPDPPFMTPQQGCVELISGWDLGDVNHAAVIMERLFRQEPKRLDKDAPPQTEQDYNLVSVFKVIDELHYLSSDVSIAEFTHEFLNKMAFWRNIIGQDISWQHWSDRQAFDQKSAHSKRSDMQEVFLASGGEIDMRAAEKGDGTVKQRINITRKLLTQNRLFVGKLKCQYTIDCLQGLKKGKTVNQPVAKGSKYKHGWDALTYPIQMLTADEVQDEIFKRHTMSRATFADIVTVNL